MITYDKHDWTSHLFDLRGSMVREILGRVSVCVVWSAVVVAIDRLAFPLQISPVAHTLVGAALALLLVFRTNSSNDRYWDGRKQWGAITNASRNIARATRAYLANAAPDLSEKIGQGVVAYAFATLHFLRGQGILGAARDHLPQDEADAMLAAPHPPLAVAARLSERLAEARDRGAISDLNLLLIDRHVAELIDALGACERIHKTPLPFVYVVHLRRALILYCFTLPFALDSLYGWWTVPVTLVISYTLFGIEEIGVEIENPFGNDANDLPLEQFCQTIERDVLSLLPPVEPAESPRPSFPS